MPLERTVSRYLEFGTPALRSVGEIAMILFWSPVIF